MSFVTVLRNSKEGQKYLWGKDSKNRYIPIRSETFGQDTVTFQVIPKDQIAKPSLNILFGELLKWRKLVFVLFPFIHWLVLGDSIDMGVFGFALAASLLLFWGVSWQADFLDHLKGYDVSSDPENKKVLAKGWLSAGFLHHASWVLVGLSLLLSIMVFLVRPALIFVALFVAALLIFLFFSKGRAYKQRGIFDFGLILITGPLFTGSIQYALFGQVTFSEILFGIIWGMLFLFSHSVQSFSKAIQLAQQNIEPWLFLRDFDKNKHYFPIFWICILSLYFIYESLNYRVLLASLDLIIILFFTLKWAKTLKNLNSPLGSSIKKASEEGHQLVLLFIFLWFTELIFAEFIKSVAKFL